MDNTNIAQETAPVSQRIMPAKVPVTPVLYHGKNGQVFRLHILNLLMNFITLGIYSFWGKTRIRKYMTSHLAIAKERFEYTGTGGELLIGWIKAMAIFLPLIVCLYIRVVNMIAFPIFFVILSLALYLALRYRLSRTKWRGIKFALKGSIKEYFWLSLKRTFINIFTLGYKIPKSDILLWSYIGNNMFYGDIKFSYEGDYKRLRKIHLMTLAIFIVAVLLPTIGGISIAAYQNLRGISSGNEVHSSQETGSEEYSNSLENIPATENVNQVAPQAGEEINTVSATEKSLEHTVEKGQFDKEIFTFVGLFYVFLGIGLLSRMWYHAALWQERFRGLRLGELRFKCDITGGGLARLFVSNMALIIVTLGLARPIAANRSLRYYAKNIRIGGDLSQLIAAQDKTKTSGMGDALAADVGFDLGL